MLRRGKVKVGDLENLGRTGALKVSDRIQARPSLTIRTLSSLALIVVLLGGASAPWLLVYYATKPGAVTEPQPQSPVTATLDRTPVEPVLAPNARSVTPPEAVGGETAPETAAQLPLPKQAQAPLPVQAPTQGKGERAPEAPSPTPPEAIDGGTAPEAVARLQAPIQAPSTVPAQALIQGVGGQAPAARSATPAEAVEGATAPETVASLQQPMQARTQESGGPATTEAAPAPVLPAPLTGTTAAIGPSVVGRSEAAPAVTRSITAPPIEKLPARQAALVPPALAPTLEPDHVQRAWSPSVEEPPAPRPLIQPKLPAVDAKHPPVIEPKRPPVTEAKRAPVTVPRRPAVLEARRPIDPSAGDQTASINKAPKLPRARIDVGTVVGGLSRRPRPEPRETPQPAQKPAAAWTLPSVIAPTD